MSTKMQCRIESSDATVIDATDDAVRTWMVLAGQATIANIIPRADFIAAVESELGGKFVPADAVVIERSELSEPEVRDGWLNVLGASFFLGGDSPARARDYLLAAASAVVYFETHPPVDQATVDALKKVVREFAATNRAYPISHRDGAAADARADGLVRALIERFEVTPKDRAR